MGPSIQIRINLSTLASLNDVHNGDTSEFIVEKPCSTSDVVGRIKANLNNFLILGYLINTHLNTSQNMCRLGLVGSLLKILNV